MLSRLNCKIFRANKFVFRKFTTGGQNLSSNFENNCKNKCNNCNLEIINKKLRLNYSIGFFIVGGCVEMYTFSKSNDFSKSTGLGWSVLAIILFS